MSAREDLEEMAAATAEALGHVAPEGVGFAVLFFDFGDAGSCAYAANAERDGVIKALRETADRLEAGEGERRQRGV